jgi:DNA processing protein
VDETLDLLTLSLLPDVGPRALRALRERGTMAAVLAAPQEHADLLGTEALAQIASGAARKAAECEQALARGQGVRIVGWSEPDYPQMLLQIFDPPPVLYVRGALVADEGTRSVAVVGSRAASPQGTTLARALGRDLAGMGFIVISGLARGIDTAAHLGALDAGCRTVAVLGSGLDRMYPPENEGLAQALVKKGGALVSEFRLGAAPSPGHFPRRNRMIAGWSRAVVVVEAAERSGALSTARQALDEGREVLAVPGHPSFAGAAGTNALLRDGAALVRNARDVAETLGFDVPAAAKHKPPVDGVLAAVPREAPVSIEEIQRQSGQPLPAVMARLSTLEIEARVRRLPGALYVRN